MNPHNPLNFEQQGKAANDVPNAPKSQISHILEREPIIPTKNLSKLYMAEIEAYFKDTPTFIIRFEQKQGNLSDLSEVWRYALQSHKNKKTF